MHDKEQMKLLVNLQMTKRREQGNDNNALTNFDEQIECAQYR